MFGNRSRKNNRYALEKLLDVFDFFESFYFRIVFGKQERKLTD